MGGGPSKQDGEVAPLATQLQVCMRTLPTPLAQHLGMTVRDPPLHSWRRSVSTKSGPSTSWPRALLDTWETRGTAWTSDERVARRIDGLLPPAIETMEVRSLPERACCPTRTYQAAACSPPVLLTGL